MHSLKAIWAGNRYLPVEQDLKDGTLVEIIPDVWKHTPWSVTMFAAHRRDKAIGPAAKWFIEQSGQALQKIKTR